MGIGMAIESAIDGLLSAFVAEKMSALCLALAPIALAAITIYILRQAYSLIEGTSGSTFNAIVGKSFRIAFITGISLNVGVYQSMIWDGFNGIETTLMMTLSGVSSVGELVDNLAAPFAELGQKLWSEATTGFWPIFGLLAAAGGVAIAQVALFMVGLGLYLLAKVALVLLIALGPLYIFCAITPSTEKFTESWLGQVLNYTVLKVLIALCITMLTDFVSKFAAHINDHTDSLNVLKAVISLCSCCGALLIVMLNIPQIASALAGGASISGVGRTVARFLLDYLHAPSGKTPPAEKHPSPSSISNQSPNRASQAPPPAPLYQRNTIDHLHART